MRAYVEGDFVRIEGEKTDTLVEVQLNSAGWFPAFIEDGDVLIPIPAPGRYTAELRGGVSGRLRFMVNEPVA